MPSMAAIIVVALQWPSVSGSSSRPGRLQAGDVHPRWMLDGEPVPDDRRLAGLERELPGQLAQVGLLGRTRGRLPQPDLDIAVRGYGDVVVDADPGRDRTVILDGRLV